jgi:hypothetical protein
LPSSRKLAAASGGKPQQLEVVIENRKLSLEKKIMNVRRSSLILAMQRSAKRSFDSVNSGEIR